MTDLTVIKRNDISGASIRLYVRNIQNFSAEDQKLFAELGKALDYPMQTDLEQWEGNA